MLQRVLDDAAGREFAVGLGFAVGLAWALQRAGALQRAWTLQGGLVPLLVGDYDKVTTVSNNHDATI